MEIEIIEFKGSCQSCSTENWLQLVRIDASYDEAFVCDACFEKHGSIRKGKKIGNEDVKNCVTIAGVVIGSIIFPGIGSLLGGMVGKIGPNLLGNIAGQLTKGSYEYLSFPHEKILHSEKPYVIATCAGCETRNRIIYDRAIDYEMFSLWRTS